jgi:hypothetical protein
MNELKFAEVENRAVKGTIDDQLGLRIIQSIIFICHRFVSCVTEYVAIQIIFDSRFRRDLQIKMPIHGTTFDSVKPF